MSKIIAAFCIALSNQPYYEHSPNLLFLHNAKSALLWTTYLIHYFVSDI